MFRAILIKQEEREKDNQIMYAKSKGKMYHINQNLGIADHGCIYHSLTLKLKICQNIWDKSKNSSYKGRSILPPVAKFHWFCVSIVKIPVPCM